jgi:hypothetical protein
MSRVTLVYILVLFAAAGAVTLIVNRGQRLTAPPDVSGEWAVGRIDASSPAPADTVGRRMFIEQSGRFVRMTFENGLQLDAKLLFEPRPHQQGLTLRFRSSDWELTAEGGDVNGPLVCQLIGTERYPFTLSRPVIEQRPTSMPVAEADARAAVKPAATATATADADTQGDAVEPHAP